jgi:hypothetical protein
MHVAPAIQERTIEILVLCTGQSPPEDIIRRTSSPVIASPSQADACHVGFPNLIGAAISAMQRKSI